MKITAKRIKKRWIAGGIVIVAAAVGIALFVKAKGSKDTVNAGSGQQSTVQLSKQDLVGLSAQPELLRAQRTRV